MLHLLKKTKSFGCSVAIPFLRMLFYNTICKCWINWLGCKDNRIMKYRLSLCLIFKNEAPFLKEWLEYHSMLGVEHFYMYNNNSTDNFREIIQPYIEKGIITLIEWPYEQSQFKAYKDCYDRFRFETNWLSFLDADEFICLKYQNNIVNWLSKFDKYPAVNIHWLMFGTGGVVEHDYSSNVIEQYFASWDCLNKHGKCIINTRYDIANFHTWYVHHHTYMYYKICGIRMVIPAVNQFGYICTIDKIWGGGKDKLKSSTIQINHYFTKSWSIYSTKMKKTDVLFENNPKADYGYFYRYEDKCIVRNFTIQRFFVKMKIEQKLIK